MTNEQLEALKKLFDNPIKCPECGADMAEIDFYSDYIDWDCYSRYYYRSDKFEQSDYCKRSAKINQE